MARKDIKRYSPEELKALRVRGKTRTRADAPVREIDADFWEHAHLVMPGPGKTSVHLRVWTATCWSGFGSRAGDT